MIMYLELVLHGLEEYFSSFQRDTAVSSALSSSQNAGFEPVF